MGYNVQDSIGALPGVLAMAAAGGTELAQTADIASNIMQGFGIEASNMGNVADILTKAFTSSNVTLDMLGDSMRYVGPNAAAAGYSIEEMAAAVGLLGNAGIQGSMSGTSLRSMIERFSGPVPAATKLMKELGIEVVNADGTMKSLADIVEEVTAGTADLGEAQRLAAVKTLVGSRASASFLALMDAGPDVLREFTHELENSGGAAGEIAARQLDNLAGSLLLLRSAIEGALISIGSSLTPAIRALTDVLTVAVTWFNNLSDNTKSFIAIGTAVAAVFALIVGPLLIMISLLPAFIAGITTIAGLFGLTGAAFTLIVAKIGLVIAAIIAIPSALYIAYNELTWFKTAVDSVFSGLLTGVNLVWQGIKAGADLAVSGLVASFEGIRAATPIVAAWAVVAGQTVAAGFLRVGEWMGGFGVALYNGLMTGLGAIGDFFVAIGAQFSGLGEALAGPIGSIVDYVISNFSTIGDVLLSLTPMVARLGLAFLGLSGPVGWIIGAVISVGIAVGRFVAGNEEAQQVLLGVWESIKSVIGGVLTALQPIFDVFVDAFSEMAADLWPEFVKTAQVISDSLSDLGPAFAGLGGALGDLRAAFGDLFSMVGEVATEFVALSIEILPELLSAAGFIFTSVLSIARSVFPIVGSLLQTLIPLVLMIVKDVLPPLLDVAKMVFNGLLSVVQVVLPAVLAVIASIIPVALMIAQTVIPLILEIFSIVFPAILDIISSVIPIVISIIEAIIPVVMLIVTTVIPLILQVVQAVFPVVLAIIQAVFPVIMAIFEGAVLIITNVLIPAIEFILSIVQIVFPLIVTIIETAMTMIMSVINIVTGIIQGDWEAVWDGIKTYFAAVWNLIKTVLSTAIELVVAILVGAWNLIKAVTTTTWQVIKGILAAVWAGIKTVVTAGITAAKSIMESTWNAIRTAATTIWNSIVAMITGVWDGIKIAVSNAINTIKTTLETVWNTIKSTITTLVTDIYNTIRGKFDDMKNAVDERIRQARDFIELGWQAAQDYLAGIDLWQIGKDIIGGLTRGIRNAMSTVREAVSGIGSYIPNWLKKTLGIASPSKVMAKLAQWIPKGIATGIDGNVRSVEQSVKAMASLVPKEIDAPRMAPMEVSRPNLKGVSGNYNAEIKAGLNEPTIRHQTVNVDRMFDGANITLQDGYDTRKLMQDAGDFVANERRRKGMR